jgi:hypothetical protein
MRYFIALLMLAFSCGLAVAQFVPALRVAMPVPTGAPPAVIACSRFGLDLTTTSVNLTTTQIGLCK